MTPLSRSLLVLLGVAGFALGCGPVVEYHATNAPPHPLVLKKPDGVDLVTIPPGRPYAEIGVLGIHVTASNDDIRQVAAVHGCDAVVFKGPGLAPCLVYTENESVISP
jgi:hypothetical protein